MAPFYTNRVGRRTHLLNHACHAVVDTLEPRCHFDAAPADVYAGFAAGMRQFASRAPAVTADAFDKDAPERAFGRLGPLTRTFPGEPSVRFHLGVLLIWTGRVKAAERQFRLATRTQPGSPLAREAARYLETIRHARS